MNNVKVDNVADGDDDTNQKDIKSLEAAVTAANNEMLNWKALTGSGRVPSNVKDQLKFLGALAKAEDDLARANFRKDVKDEWGRIERIVDQELERMAGLEKGEEVDLYLRCAMCNDDISNALLLMKKRGTTKCYKLSCCGRKLCASCHEKHDPMRGVKEKLEKLTLECGVMAIQDPGPERCPNCGGDLPEGDKECFKLVEKFAQQGVAWAMGDLALAYANGKYGTKLNPQKSKKWLIKAAKAKDTQSQYHLGLAYEHGAGGRCPPPFGEFSKSPTDAIKWYLKAADKGCVAAYINLARAYHCGDLVEKDTEKEFRYASLAVYQNDGEKSEINVKACQQLYLSHWDSVDSSGSAESSPPNDSAFNLHTYWSGKAAEVDSCTRSGQTLANTISMYAAFDYWYKHIQNNNLPGISVLCVAKRLELKYKSPKSSNFITHFEDFCARCKKDKDGTLKRCNGCKVFYYCGKSCQLEHWKHGHKKECKGDHWILEHFPNLNL